MPTLKTIQLHRAKHREQEVVLVGFEYNPELTAIVKQLPGAYWSQGKKSWYIPEKQFDLHRFFETFRGKAWVDYSGLKLKPAPAPLQKEAAKDYAYRTSTKLPKGYLEMLEQKRYSQSTIRTYCAYFKDFQFHFQGQPLDSINAEAVNGYILGLIKTKKISASQQNQRINAIHPVEFFV